MSRVFVAYYQTLGKLGARIVVFGFKSDKGMGINRMKKKTIIMILIAVSLMLQLTGCTKMFWEYEYVWVSESPYVRFEEEKGKAYVEIDDIAKMVSRDMLERSEELKKRFGTYEPHFHKVEKKENLILRYLTKQRIPYIISGKSN